MIETYRDFFIGLHGFPLVLLIFFAFLYILRWMHLIFFQGRILFRKKTTSNSQSVSPLSVFLTIRNDEEDLRNYLPKLLSINDVEYEVIVVDDYSQDNSYLVLGSLRKQYPNLKISTLNEETRFSMKLAQNIAIKAAKNDWVLSVPVAFNNSGNPWLSDFSNQMADNKTVIIGYSTVNCNQGYYNRLYRMENFHSYLKSVGLILNHLPVVYAEENVAFRKKQYFEMGGYGIKIKEPFANLELLINTFIKTKKTSILFSPESSIVKLAEIGRTDFYDLLKKNLRIEKHLPASKKLFLRLEEITKLLLPLLFIAVTILFPVIWILIAILAMVKIIAHLFIIKIALKHLNERKIFIPSLVYDLLMPYYKTVYRWYFNYRSRKNKWRNKG